MINLTFARDIFIPIGPERVSLFTLASYLLTWLLYLIILISSLIYGRIGTPRAKVFDSRSQAIVYPYISEADTFAPIWFLILCSFVFPSVYTALISFKFGGSRSLRARLWNFHCCMLALLGSLTLQLFIVSCIKNVASVPRPDFLSRCKLSSGTNQQIVPVSSCNPTSISILREGLRSFPSGHASTIFASSTIQMLYGINFLELYDKRGFGWKLILSIVYPLVLALVVAFSRVSDNRHRTLDVVAGSIIGAVSSLFVFHMYFPFHVTDEQPNAYLPRRFLSPPGRDQFWNLDHPPEEEEDEGVNMFFETAIRPRRSHSVALHPDYLEKVMHEGQYMNRGRQTV